mgnify:CR=1 FL=1
MRFRATVAVVLAWGTAAVSTTLPVYRVYIAGVATVHVRDLAQGQAACPVCGEPLARRADDQPEVIAKRLKVYAAQTETLIAYYERRGKLVRVDGDQPVERVTEQILGSLRGRT